MYLVVFVGFLLVALRLQAAPFDPFSDDARLELQRVEAGTSISVVPDQTFFDRGEIFELRASVVESGDRFLHWLKFEGDDEIGEIVSKELTFRTSLTVDTRFVAVSAEGIPLGDGELLVPRFGVNLVSVDDGVLLEEIGDFKPHSIFLEAEGPGALLVDLLQGDGLVGSLSRAGRKTEAPALVTDWVDRYSTRLEYELEGTVFLSNIEVRRGYPLEISNLAEGGVVANVPVDGFYQSGKTLLEAVPDDGWSFYYWENNRTGDKYYENPLLLNQEGILELSPTFGEKRQWGGVEMIVSEPEAWEIEDAKGGESILNQESRGVPLSSVSWTLEGPGVFEIESDGLSFSGDFVLDGVVWKRFYSSTSDGVELHRVEVGEGRHTFEFNFEGFRSSAGEIPFVKFSSPKWRSGFVVRYEAYGNGRVEGTVNNEEIVSQDGAVALKAIPNPGSVFVGWRGSYGGDQEDIDFKVDRPVDVVAVFVEIVEGDDLWEKTGGSKSWTRGATGWNAPEDLEEGEVSYLSGFINGPGKLDLKLGTKGSGEYRLFVGDEEYEIEYDKEILVREEGRLPVKVVATPASNGSYRPLKELQVVPFYRVEFTVENGTIETEPELEFSNDIMYAGYVAAGTLVTYSLNSYFDTDFIGWSGGIEGDGLTGEFVVEEMVEAVAEFELDEVVWSDQFWSVHPSNSLVYSERWEEYRNQDIATDVVLRTEIDGPALLDFGYGVSSVIEVKVDGELTYSGGIRTTENGQLGFPVVQEGRHEVEVILKSSQYSPFKYIKKIDVVSGYAVEVDSTEWSGGRVDLLPNQNVYESGESIHVYAVPEDGNRFADWTGAFSGYASDFEWEVNDHRAIGARFEALDSIDGLSITYDIGVPFALSNDAYYSLVYDIRDLGEGGAFEGSLVINEPGLYQISSFDYRQFSILLNGVEVESNGGIDGSVWNSSFEIEEAGAVFEWSANPEISYFNKLFLGLPKRVDKLTLDYQSADAEIQVDNSKEFYEFEDLVTLTAPSKDLLGRSFVGWFFSDYQRTPYSNDNSIVVRMDRNYSFRAVYDSGEIRIGGLYVEAGYDVDSRVDSVELDAPVEGTFWRSEEREAIRVSADQPSVLRMYTKSDGEDRYLSVSASSLFDDGVTLIEGWSSHEIYVPAGKTVVLGFSSNVLFGGFSVEERESVTILGLGLGNVVTEKQSIEGEDWYSVQAAPEDRDRLTAWIDDEYGWSIDDVKLVPANTSSAVMPYWVTPKALPVGLAIDWERSIAWYPLAVDGSEDGGRYRLKLNSGVNPLSKASFLTNGPRVLYIDAEDSSDLDHFVFYVNGEEVNYEYSRELEGVVMVQLLGESGRLEIERRDLYSPADAYLTLVNTVEGYFVERDGFEGGEVVLNPDRDVYRVGDEINVVAKPIEGYELLDWEGGYSEKGSDFTITSWSGEAFVPRFRVKEIKLNAFGLDWVVVGAEVEERIITDYFAEGVRVDSPYVSIDGYSYSNLRYAISNVVGPKVLRTTMDGIEIDGVDLADWSGVVVWDDGVPSYGIPRGEHVIVCRFGSRDTMRMDLYDGVLVDAQGKGVSVSIEPRKPYYEIGDEVEITSGGSFAEDWIIDGSFSAEIENAARFELEDHMQVEVLNWKTVDLFGHDLYYAGNGYLEYLSVTDSYDIKGTSRALPMYLRFDASYGGELSYLFARGVGIQSNLEVSVSTEIGLEGEPVGLSKARGSVELGESGGRVVFKLNAGKPINNSVSAAVFSLEKLDWTHQRYNDFDAWWNNWLESEKADDYQYSLLDDADFDGFSLFEEYLIGLDAEIPEFRIGFDYDREGKMGVVVRSVPASVQDLFRFEYSNDGHFWFDAKSVLGNPYAWASGLEFYPVDFDLLDANRVLYRLNYRESVPELSELLELSE